MTRYVWAYEAFMWPQGEDPLTTSDKVSAGDGKGGVGGRCQRIAGDAAWFIAPNGGASHMRRSLLVHGGPATSKALQVRASTGEWRS